MKKVLVSFSAGVDSTTLAYLYQSKGYQVTLALFDDGGFNVPESKYFDENSPVDYTPFTEEFYYYADYHARRAGFGIEEIRFPDLKSITYKGEPDNEYAAQVEAAGLNFFVGFKQIMNMLLLSVGAAQGYDVVAFGHEPYNKHYADEKPEVFQRLRHFMHDVYGNRVQIPQVEHPYYAPEYGCKENIIKKAIELGVPLDYTYSCRGYNNDMGAVRVTDGRYIHCGHCENCVERLRAFKSLGIEDTAIYAITTR